MAVNRDATAVQVAEIPSSPPFIVRGNRFDNNGAVSASRFDDHWLRQRELVLNNRNACRERWSFNLPSDLLGSAHSRADRFCRAKSDDLDLHGFNPERGAENG